MDNSHLVMVLHRYKTQLVISVLLGILLAAFMAASPGTFLRWGIYESFLSTIPFFAIPAIAMTLVVVCGEMDMCFPSTIAMSGFVFSWLWTATGKPILSVAGALCVGTVIGWTHGLIVVRIGVPSIIATIGTQFFWRGLLMVLCSGLAIDLAGIRESSLYHVFVGRIAGHVSAQALWAAGIAVIAGLLLNRHVFGDSLRFIGDNTETALKMGVPVSRVRIAVFTLMGFFCAISGIIACVEMGSWWPTQGEGYLLLVFASVFIGGTSVFGGVGSIYGTCIGAVIIGIVEAGIISAGYSGFWTRTVYGIIIVASVSLYVVMSKSRPRISARQTSH